MYLKILKGLGLSYVFTFCAFIVFAIILHLTNISDSIIPGIILLVSILGILTGSAVCTKGAETRGWLWGGCIGASYALILYIVSSLTLTGFTMPLSSFYLICGYTLIGAIGGIVGINM